MRRVVVTGLGIVAPNGSGREAFWKACCAGRSGVGRISSFDSSRHPVQIAGEVKEFDLSPYLCNGLKKSVKIMGRAAQFGLTAAGQALADSGLDLDRLNPERLGVAVGTGVVPYELSELAPALQRSTDARGQFDAATLGACGTEAIAPQWILRQLPNMIAAYISILANAQGPNCTLVTACSAATQAIGDAFRLIQRDDADFMIAGGADSRIDPLMLLAYTGLGALSRSDRTPPTVSRPFDGNRDGFVLGEGAGMLVLEELEHARRRGAEIYAEVVGFGSSLDAQGITKPDPGGRGAARAMSWALRDARVDPSSVDYIAAHGTSTRLNDAMETNAVKLVFGETARRLPLSSIKSMIGHLIGAAGAASAVAMSLTLHDGVLPPTINYEEPDPVCDLDYVPNQARETKVRTAISNSFGFGGQNAALVMQQFRL
ncbi:MAG TPA: beta-ketoacyl-ACP synthase II [Gemmatales bacterium]|nr:beta-ketoacyl-ACP synthase II [Gemmatales bacterium]HMP57827.1 beta-ketoacyl-ACP synthase II [Gemmatales bacterium]